MKLVMIFISAKYIFFKKYYSFYHFEKELSLKIL